MGTTRVLKIKNGASTPIDTEPDQKSYKNSVMLPHLLEEEEEEEAVAEEACLVSLLVVLPRTLTHTMKTAAPAQPLMAQLPHMLQNSRLL